VTGEVTEALFLRELEIQNALTHPNVLGLVGYYAQTETQPFTLLTSWMSGGSLDAIVYDPAKAAALTATQRVKIVTGIVLGMRYIHGCGIMHRDLKPGNVLLTPGLSPKIGDLGSASLEDPTISLTNNLGTACYMAPKFQTGSTRRRSMSSRLELCCGRSSRVTRRSRDF
jgi:serine/threonine protein kinase